MEPSHEGKAAKPKVLIVDDDWDLVFTLMLRLKAAGFSVEIAQDGEVGLDRALTFQPDVVLLDLLMPRLDGWEVCRRLRKNPLTRNLPVVAMTGLRRPGSDECLHGVGINKILLKPFDPDRLMEVIEKSAG